MQAPGQAIISKGLLQNVLNCGVDVHGLIGGRSSDWLCLSLSISLSIGLSIGHNFFLSATI